MVLNPAFNPDDFEVVRKFKASGLSRRTIVGPINFPQLTQFANILILSPRTMAAAAQILAAHQLHMIPGPPTPRQPKPKSTIHLRVLTTYTTSQATVIPALAV